MKTFFADQRWMEDFCASGPVGNAPAAFTNLATLVWNEPAAGKVGLLRNIATAMALNSTAKSSPLGWVRLLAVYHFLSEQGRLHRRSLTQSVREWRFVVCEGRAAVDILWLNYFRNLPHEGYARTYTSVPYRLHNCFGESVHNRRFYEPWWGCPWSMWRIRREVGGVCGALSTFGAQCTNAHGLPATPGGQPGHCIFNRRQLNGRWTIHNYISAPSFAKFNLWGSPFTFLDVVERSFADRERQLVAERCVWLATFVREARKDWPQQETWYRKGAAANPKHYGLWIAWVNALVQSKASAESCHVFLEALVKNLPEGRQATWSVIHQCLQYLVKLPKGQELAVRELEGIYPKLAQTAMPPTREEVDLSSVFSRQLGLIRNPQLRARLITAALAAQPKVNGFYLQLMMAASKSGDVAVFQAAAADYNRRSPIPAKAAQWPIEDFGGRLLSEKGMLAVGNPQNGGRNHPELYARAIGPLKVVDPAHPRQPATFQTRASNAVWAMVQLSTATNVVTGVVLTNLFGKQASCQVPFAVSVSTNGKKWNQVALVKEVKGEYRIPLEKPVPARFVKVERATQERKEPFQFSKFLVYGK